MADRRGTPALVVTGLSARALAAAARRAGFIPLAADLFADRDTRALAAAALAVAGDGAGGLDPAALEAAIDTLRATARREGLALRGIVYASGFEETPERLARLAAQLPLLGNPPEVVARVKAPAQFAALCRHHAIPHPAISATPAPAGAWLEKRIGGAGGGHIRAIPAGTPPRPSHYLQARRAGQPVSAFFVANGREAVPAFFSAQWPDPAPGAPFRFGGAVRPATIAPRIAARLTAAIQAITESTGLVGINSADFLLDGDEWALLEINPRPGATLDLAPRAALRWHLASLHGRLPRRLGSGLRAAAAAIFYAPRRMRVDGAAPWPAWTMDRPTPGTEIAAGAPVCSLRAVGANAEAALASLAKRRQRLATRVEIAP
jgi:predicted ATP-grasp superfamily ATP-dependent carboligase